VRGRGVRRLALQASAKVNLALELLGKRQDSYHELVTLLQAIDLSDRLVLEDNDALTLKTNDPELPTDEGNLALRGARLLQDAAQISRGVRIMLEKRIPVAAGLGGGSSDAAATLWGLNRLWGLRWPTARLAELSAELGMDVPFFLQGGRVLATGRGEILNALPPAPGLALVLVNPNFPLSTQEVYNRVPADLQGDGSRAKALIGALATRSPARVAASLYNNLEEVVQPMCPAIARIKRALLAAGALGAVMSGSGPTVVGMARSLDHARQIRTRLTTGAWACWAVRSLSGPAVRVVRGSGV
jgi:4-diphosphocytidyl-2-C-methyl-D-erythritol kinase